MKREEDIGHTPEKYQYLKISYRKSRKQRRMMAGLEFRRKTMRLWCQERPGRRVFHNGRSGQQY